MGKEQATPLCVNDLDIKVKPTNDLPILAHRQGLTSYVAHDSFIKMLEASWYKPEATITNVMAVLKRTRIFLNTQLFLYVRPASEFSRQTCASSSCLWFGGYKIVTLPSLAWEAIMERLRISNGNTFHCEVNVRGYKQKYCL